MTKNPYHFRYHDDALIGYSELSLELRGAYTTLLDLMYSREGALDDNERRLGAEMGVGPRKYRSLRDALIRAGKLYYFAPGKLSNKRVEEELGRRAKRALNSRNSGELGGKKKAENARFRNEINKTVYPNSSHTRTRKNKITNSYSEADSEGVSREAEIHELPHIAAARQRMARKGSKW